MPSYTPNAFATGAAPSTNAYAQGLRSYAPNYFSGSNPSTITGEMAPHLSVAAADRPYAADIALLQGSPDYAKYVPKSIDSMWRYSPQTYESRVGALLRQPGAQGALETLRNPPPKTGDTRQVMDSEGNPITQVWRDADSGWVTARPDRGDSGD